MSSSTNPKILILEDDDDQMQALALLTVSQIERLLDYEKLLGQGSVSDNKTRILQSISIKKVNNIESLKEVVSKHSDIFLAILDCNVPDDEGQTANNQLIEVDGKITGQHKAVDLILEHLPNASITMVSLFERFETVLSNYYKNEAKQNIEFISKTEKSKIKQNIAYFLMQYLFETDE